MDIPLHRQMGAHVQITGVWQWLGNGPALLHGSSWICRHIPSCGRCSPTPSHTSGHAPWLGEHEGVTCARATVSSATQQAIHHQILTQFHQTATPDIQCIALGALALILESSKEGWKEMDLSCQCAVWPHTSHGGATGLPNSHQLFP